MNVPQSSQPEPIGNPTPDDFLKESGADIFLFGDTVFSNAEQVDWVKDSEYTLGEVYGEITKQSGHAAEFEHGTANRLPVGTKIYRTDTPVYIADVDGKRIPYLQMVEG